METNFKNNLAPAVIELNKMNDELQGENARLKKEVADYHQLQWQHDALIDEHERLKRELKQTEVQDQVVFENLREENAKLKCLALHAMCRWLDSWSIGVGINIMKHRKFGLFKQIKRHLLYYRQAYCEAKRELKCGRKLQEGK